MTEPVRVLVVDDSEFFGTLVAGELERLYDMETRRTSNSDDALKYIEHGDFECIISDYDMPETDGIEFFEQLRDRGCDVPFFLLTAAGSEEVASRAITAGIDDYFPKTKGEDQFEILGKRVQNVVSKRRTARNLERRRRLNETLWKITRELMHSPTRAEIGDSVCERLVEFDQFAFAWMETNESETIGVAGIEDGPLSDVRTTVQDSESEPTQRALTQQRIETASLDVSVDSPARENASPATSQSKTEFVAIPLLHQGTTYGVLTVATADGHTVESSDRDALGHLGTTVGHALAAVEMQREVEIFREAVDQADPAIAITNTDGSFEYVNLAFEKITGYDAELLHGESITLVATDRFDSRDYYQLLERVQDGETVREEVVQRRADGTQFYADLSVAPITVDGAIEQFVLIESDITELKSREQRLEVLNRVLRHNLRNDLNAIKGFLSLLLEDVDTEQHRSHAEVAQRKVESLLTVSEKAEFVNKKVEAADRQGSHPRVGLADLLRTEIEAVRETYPEADISLDADEEVATRATNLEVAVHELLDNAIQHNESDNPQVDVAVTTETAQDGIVDVRITDDGPGIPELERETLASGTETDLQHGSSLGLWLVHWIVTFIGGQLRIESADDSGSTVCIALPLAGSS